MPFLNHGSYRIRYELEGPADAPAYVLVNGLTQYAELWAAYREALVARQFRVATFDLLGQGASDKPALFISQDDQVEALHLLIGQLGDGPIFLSGISFGGLIALRYAITHGKRLAGLVPMSCFAELPPQLLLLGNALRTALILGGTSYLQDLLLPMNVSDKWLRPLLDKLDSVKRQGWLVNDVYALQNLMESFLDFQPLTPQLSAIGVPTMILNGEFDFLTPRALHETLRVQIPNSSLVIIPRAYHAFTLEKPALTADLLARFAEDVLAGRWQGNKAVWIAPEEAGGDLVPFPARFLCRGRTHERIFRPARLRRPRAAATADARCLVSDLGPWRAGAAVRICPAAEARIRMANRIERAVLPRNRARFPATARDLVGAGCRVGLHGCILGDRMVSTADRGDSRSATGAGGWSRNACTCRSRRHPAGSLAAGGRQYKRSLRDDAAAHRIREQPAPTGPNSLPEG
jgi:3-oxoadipate enol-lactonase